MSTVDVLDLEELLFVLFLSLEPFDSRVLQLVGLVILVLVEVCLHDFQDIPQLVLTGQRVVGVQVSHHVVPLVPVTLVLPRWLTRGLEHSLELLERLVYIEVGLGGVVSKVGRECGGLLGGDDGNGTSVLDGVFAFGTEGGEGGE